MLEISSPQNPKIKQLAKLRTRKIRNQSGLYLIDGAREILRAIRSGQQIKHLLIDFSFDDGEDLAEIKELARSKSLDIWNVSSDALEKVEFGDRREGIVAIGVAHQQPISDLKKKENSLTLILEGIEKPGNFGAILRSADAVGIDQVIVCDPKTDLYNPATIRASLGTIFSLSIAVGSSGEAIQWLKSNQISVFGAICDGNKTYTDIDFRGEVAIVMGTEADGLSNLWNNADVQPIQIPMNGIADSLNVSVAAAVLLYEALRQRSL